MKLWQRGFLVAASLALLVAPSAGAATRDVNLGFSIMQWINAVEIFAGKQVIDRGQDKDVVDFARFAVDAHTRIARELVSFAEKKEIIGVNIREEANDARVAALIPLVVSATKLKDLKGADLDKAFVELMIKVHELSLRNLSLAEAAFGASEEGRFLIALRPAAQVARDRATALARKFH